MGAWLPLKHCFLLQTILTADLLHCFLCQAHKSNSSKQQPTGHASNYFFSASSAGLEIDHQALKLPAISNASILHVPSISLLFPPLSFARALAYSLACSLAHSFARSLTRSITPSLTHSPACLPTYLLACLLARLFNSQLHEAIQVAVKPIHLTVHFACR